MKIGGRERERKEKQMEEKIDGRRKRKQGRESEQSLRAIHTRGEM